MSENKHTPEPWEKSAIGTTVFHKESRQKICTLSKWIRIDGNRNHDMEEANARRIVACVNACAGISDEALEVFAKYQGLPALDEMLVEIRALNKQRDELRAEVMELEREVAHWKNNHETEVRRASILKERTDMPIERVQAYEKWGQDQLRIDKLRLQIDHLHMALADTEALELGTAEKLAESKAREKQLLDCLESITWSSPIEWVHQQATEALALPRDDTALRELLKAERERCAKVCAKEAVQIVIDGPEERAYNNAVSDCAAAIRNMGEECCT